MKKLIAVALLAVPFTFAQAPASSQAPTTDTAKTKKHHNKTSKKKGAKTDTTTQAAPATK